jgi:diaminopimelate decarboxylase
VSGLNLDLHALQREFRSPQFIVSESRILENLGHFTRLTGTTNRVFFPVKANPALAVLQILARNGVGEDCASAHEVYLATLVGIPFERVLYTTPATDLDYALRLLRAGASVVIDHIADLLELDALLRPLNETLPGKILVRLNPDFSIRYDQTADHQEMTAHAAVSSKFGIPSEDLLEVMAKVQLRISGLHLHVGTQMDTLKPFLDALAHLHALADELRAVGHPIELLDLGGGLGIPFGKEDRFPTLSEFVSALVPHQRPDTYRYAVEPGHALIGNAVSLLLTLEKIKASRGKRWGVTNVGTDSLAKVTLLRWQHRVFHAQGGAALARSGRSRRSALFRWGRPPP